MRFVALVFIPVSLGLLLFSDSQHVVAQGSRSARVIAEKANLRETPYPLGLAEGEVTEGTIVKILDEKLPWYVVRVGDRVGWMHGATLQFVSSAEVSDQQQEPVRLMTVPDREPFSRTFAVHGVAVTTSVDQAERYMSIGVCVISSCRPDSYSKAS